MLKEAYSDGVQAAMTKMRLKHGDDKAEKIRRVDQLPKQDVDREPQEDYGFHFPGLIQDRPSRPEGAFQT